MAYGSSNSHVTDDVTWPRKVKLVASIHLKPPYPENSWTCYLETIANYKIVCCNAVRSAILATAWLLVSIPTNKHYGSKTVLNASSARRVDGYNHGCIYTYINYLLNYIILGQFHIFLQQLQQGNAMGDFNFWLSLSLSDSLSETLSWTLKSGLRPKFNLTSV